MAEQWAMLRWIGKAGALFVLAALVCTCGVLAAESLRGSNGEPTATLVSASLSGEAWFRIGFMGLVGLIIASVGAFSFGRWIGNALIGVGLLASTVQMGDFAAFLRQGGGAGGRIVEAMAWSIVLWALAHYMKRMPRHGSIEEPGPGNPSPEHWLASVVRVALVGMLTWPIVWFLARTGLKGQVLAATSIAGVVVGLVGHLLATRSRLELLYAVVPLAGAVAYAVAAWREPEILLSEIAAGWIPFALPMPLDYTAGSMLGVTAGIAWSRSLEHEAPPESGEATAAKVIAD